MGQIEDLRFFVQIIDAGGISKAAETLNIAKSALSRRLALLEDRYEAKLIDRAPGLWQITQTGNELYKRAIRVVGDIDEIDADFMSASADLAGPLSVSVPREFGLGYLINALTSFKVNYPEITFTIDFDDRQVDLTRENYDYAIRISPSHNHGVLVQNIGTVGHGLYASKSYFEKTPKPETLGDLGDQKLLYFGNARRAEWSFVDGRGKSQSIQFQPFLNSNSGLFLLESVKAGVGIARLPSFLVKSELSKGGLVPVLSDLDIPNWDINLVYAENRHLNRRMRLFAQEIKKACAAM